jgi:protein-S-isoprenylcysteine O-methyltransferase Ste14
VFIGSAMVRTPESGEQCCEERSPRRDVSNPQLLAALATRRDVCVTVGSTERHMGRLLGFVYGVACYSIMLGTLGYLLGFLADRVVPKTIDTGPTAELGVALLIDAALIVLFGVQHSVMARPQFKEWWTRVVPPSIERSTYVLLASGALILLFWEWRPIDAVVWQADAAWMRGAWWTVYALGIALLLASTFVIDHFDLFGLRQVTLSLLRRPYTDLGFKVVLFYRFVRHPIYLGWLMIFWATPRMTLGHLLFAAAMSAYIFIAVRYEERDLVSVHGADYVQYRRRVPMLVPRIARTRLGNDMTRAGSR